MAFNLNPSTRNANPPAAAGGFSFAAPAPSTSSSSTTFGGSAASETIASNTLGTSTGSGNFSFGGLTSARSSEITPIPAPATGGFSFSGKVTPEEVPATSSTATNNPLIGTIPSQQTVGMITIPFYANIFRGELIWKELKHLAEVSCKDSDEGKLAGEQLIEILRNHCDKTSVASQLISPSIIQYRQPDMNLRRRLAENPVVILTLANHQQQEATVTPHILEEVCSLSDSLYISEQEALSLYRYVANQSHIHASFADVLRGHSSSHDSSTNNTLTHPYDSSTCFAARMFYYYERSLLQSTTLMLLQYRQNSSLVARATDALLQEGLITNLIQLVREYTIVIDQLLQKAEQFDSEMSTTSILQWAGGLTEQNAAQAKHQRRCFKQHLDFIFQERQTATECLFFISYEVQLTATEIAAILDLLRDLTNGTAGASSTGVGLPLLNPFTDVPDPYEHMQPPTDHQAQEFIGSMYNSPWTELRKEKDPATWQRQLVESLHNTGFPTLLRCVSTLIITCITALGTHNVFFDRNTHEPNSFGKGNALLPPETFDTNGLNAVHSRLNKQAVKDWKRSDILGLLMAAYAMLLRSSPSAMTSPRRGDSSFYGNTVDIRRTWRECVESPSELKSFTFARLSLIPALRKPSASSRFAPSPACDVSDFLLEALAEFVSHFFDVLSASGDRPISRAKWEQDAEDTLRLQRSHEEQHRKFQGQFSVWPSSLSGIQSVPTTVNIIERPDCMDDVIAFAAAVCSLNPEYALQFWSQEEQVGEDEPLIITKLSPSRALRELQVQQGDDHSLLPSYVSFLASLALAKNEDLSLNGAVIVNDILTSRMVLGDPGNQQSWSSVFHTLRHYVRELNPNNYMTRGTSASVESMSGMSTSSSTAYYYLEEDQSRFEYDGINDKAIDVQSPMKPKELGEENRTIVLSHLALISNVAQNNPLARSHIVQTCIPIQGSDQRDVVGHDGSLNILFTLSIMPLDPEVRGAVFRTIACLLDLAGLTSKEEIAEARKVAAKGWELLEACQIVPIRILEQYQSGRHSIDMGTSGLSFPPSTTALAAYKQDQTWLQPDPAYSILYEMEYVESSLGFYPSTASFLILLKSLFVAGGCPSTLGRGFRIRCGATPYVEYIINFVLPRAMELPFRSLQDSNRLISVAYDVIECVLSRYCLAENLDEYVPSTNLHEATRSAALNVLSHCDLAYSVTLAPHENDMKSFVDDLRVKPEFHDKRSDTNASSSIAQSRQDEQYPSESSILTGKSPGFTILFDVLSSSGGNLFQVIVRTLRQVRTEVSGLDADRFALAYGLYGATPPTFFSAKEGAVNRDSSMLLQTLLKPPFPPSDYPAFSEACFWETRALRGALMLLCSAIAREDLWNQCIRSSPIRMTLVPFLSFHKKAVPVAYDVHCTKMCQLLVSSDSETKVFSSLVECVKPECSDIGIVTAASVVIFYLDKSLRPQHMLDFVYEHRNDSLQIAEAFGRRIVSLAGLPPRNGSLKLLGTILDWFLSTLRYTCLSQQSLCHVLLGLPRPSNAERLPEKARSCEAVPNCLDAILALLKNHELVLSTDFAELASLCYEILFHLTRIKKEDSYMKMALHSVKKLRSDDFWKNQLLTMNFLLARDSLIDNVHVLHSIAWLTKGIAGELQLLAGITGLDLIHGGILSSHPTQYIMLSSMLYRDGGFMDNLLRLLPIEKIRFDALNVAVSEDTVRRAKQVMTGSPEVVVGYSLVDNNKLAETVCDPEDKKKILCWAKQWNRFALYDCASAHVSQAIQLVIASSVSSCEQSSLQFSQEVTTGYQMLICILSRLCLGFSPTGSHHSMDSMFFTAATRNLAMAVMMAARFSVSTHLHKNNIDAEAACSLLARAIVLSEASNVDNISVNDRTSFLACSLSTILQDLTHTSQIRCNATDFAEAAFVLARLSSYAPQNGVKALPSRRAIVVRAALSLILEFFCVDDISSKQFCRNVFTRTSSAGMSALESILLLVPMLDADVSTLLAKVSSLPSGTELLYELDIMDKLVQASLAYVNEESRFFNSQSNILQYKRHHVATPDFLLGHLTLMNAMMAADVRIDLQRDISSKVMCILSHYCSVIERLLLNFPLDWDVVYAVLKCLAQAKAISQPYGARIELPKVTSNDIALVEVESFVSHLESHIANVAMDIAENPLPVELLPAVPAPISNARDGVDAGAAAVGKEGLWWNNLNLVGIPSTHDRNRAFRMSDTLCAFVSDALSLMHAGLFIILGSVSVLSIDSLSLCRAVCGCVNAYRFFASTILSAKDISDLDSGYAEQLLILESKLSDAVAVLLMLLLDRVRILKERTPEWKLLSSTREIEFTLDHTQLDTVGLASMRLRVVAGKQKDVTQEISSLLRQEFTETISHSAADE